MKNVLLFFARFIFSVALCVLISAFSSFFPIISPLTYLLIIPGIIAFFLVRETYTWLSKFSTYSKAISLSGVVFATLMYSFVQYPEITEQVVFAGDFAHFEINKRHYLRAIAAESPEANIVRFSWGGFFLNPIELVYDKSGALGSSRRTKSDQRIEHVGRHSEFGSCDYSARSLYDNFYVVRFYC